MYHYLTTPIEQRVAACKKDGARWLAYDPAKVLAEPSLAEFAAQRMEIMRRLKKRWGTGLIAVADTALCVKEDGTVGFLYANVSDEERNAPNVRFLLEQRNVRKIFSDGRTAVVLYRDGTMAVNVQWKGTENQRYIKTTKEVAACFAEVNKWSGIVDVQLCWDTIFAIHESGRLLCCTNDNSSYRDIRGWASRVSGVSAVGKVSIFYYFRLTNGRIDSEALRLAEDERYTKWMKVVNHEHLDVVVSTRFLAAIKHDGSLAVWYEKDKPDMACFGAIRSWTNQATIHMGDGTLVGLAPEGEVRAVGKYAEKYRGWSDVALITGGGDTPDFAIHWDGSCTATDNKEIDADFSWIFEERY